MKKERENEKQNNRNNKRKKKYDQVEEWEMVMKLTRKV